MREQKRGAGLSGAGKGKNQDTRNSVYNLKKTKTLTLAGASQWIECWPANQRVASSIPSQGTCLGCGPGHQLGVCKRQPHTDVSLPLFLPPFPSV